MSHLQNLLLDAPAVDELGLRATAGILAEYLPAYEAAQAQAADLIWHALSHGQPPDRIHYPRIDYWTGDGI